MTDTPTQKPADQMIQQPVPTQPLTEAPTIEVAELKIIKAFGYYGNVFPVMVYLAGTAAATGANYTTSFFIAERPYVIVEAFERHEVAGTDGGTVTVQLMIVPSGTATSAGTAVFSSALSLKTTANTNQKGVISPVRSAQRLVRGDSLALLSSGTLTNVTGVTMSIILKAT